MKAQDRFDPREVDRYVVHLDPRKELVYRLAMRDLSERCRGDQRFNERTEELILQFKGELGDVLAKAEKFARDLTRK